MQALAVASLVTLTIASGAAQATTYYVDGHALPSGDGTAWSSAWNAFSAIDWAKIAPGDTIYISGGDTGQTYAAPLEPRSSGSPGLPVIIAKAGEAGHNGPVTIDGYGSTSTCIFVNALNDVTIDGVNARNCTEAGYKVHVSTNVTVQNSRIYALARGFHVWRSNNILIKRNTVQTPRWTARETDGIYSQQNTGNKYVRNSIVISNGEPNGHDDGIQSNLDDTMLFDGNYIEQRNSKTINAQGLFIQDATSTMTATNNVIYGPNTSNSLIKLLNGTSYTGLINALNNTLVGGKWGTILIQNSSKSSIHNNILFTKAVNGSGIALVPGQLPPPENIDYNFYYVPNGKPGYVVGTFNYDWEQWQGLGYEKHGLSKPLMIGAAILDSAFAPVNGSPVIDTGATLSAPKRDRVSRIRPFGDGYDIGAYEGPLP